MSARLEACPDIQRHRFFASVPSSGMTLSRLEHRHWRSRVRVLKYNGDRLADPNVVGVAGDDIGQHSGSFGERYMGDYVRLLDAAQDAEGVDGPFACGVAPFHFVPGTERAAARRLPVRAAARR